MKRKKESTIDTSGYINCIISVNQTGKTNGLVFIFKKRVKFEFGWPESCGFF